MTGPDGEQPITDYEYMEWAYSIDPSAKPPPEEPEWHPYGDRIWQSFWQLHARRRPGFEFPAPISHADIQAWAVLTRSRISPDDVNLLTQMDDAYLSAVSEGLKLKRKRDEARNKSKGKR